MGEGNLRGRGGGGGRGCMAGTLSVLYFISPTEMLCDIIIPAEVNEAMRCQSTLH